jgi:alpha-tubulin suppressor-like RCC1 family protein
VQVAAGGLFACGLRYSGTLWCWGDNQQGQLGLGAAGGPVLVPTQVVGAQTWKTVALGYSHACAVATGGALYCWGDDTHGQLGLGSGAAAQYAAPQQVGSSTAWTVLSGGTSAGRMAGTCGIQGSSGPYNGGTLWCWGSSVLAPNVTTWTPTQLGNASDWTAVSLPVAGTSACGIRTDPGSGTLWCWGNNDLGQLGLGTTGGWQGPSQVPGSEIWATVAVGNRFACATRGDGTIWCWGVNWAGQTGNGTEDTNPPSPQRAWWWTDLATFNYSTCARRSDWSLWCWGDNTWGMAGQGYTSSSPIELPASVAPTQKWLGVSASASSWHACAIRDDTTLWCWGLNTSGQLGTGDTTLRSSPAQVNGAEGWNQVSAGASHTCGIWQKTLWCWGDNGYGQLGTGNYGSSPYTVPIGSQQWLEVSAGAFSTCAIRSDHTLWCWGQNNAGQIGQGSTSTATYPTPTQVGTAATWASVRVGMYYACAVDSNGSLYCWGNNVSGQLGVGDKMMRTSPTQVGAGAVWGAPAVGGFTTCAPRADGTLWCWGSNFDGVAGQGNTTTQNYLVPTELDTQAWPSPTASWFTASVSSYHACASQGVAYCWGSNGSGQLGIGSLQPWSAPMIVQ